MAIVAAIFAVLATINGLLDATAKIKQYVIDPLKDQFSNLCCADSIFKSLEDEVKRLEIIRASLEQDVDGARQNLEIIGPEVDDWLKKVDEIKEQTNSIFRAIDEIQQGCVSGRSLNLKHYSVSRKAKKMAKAVVEIQDAGKFNRVARPAPPPGMEIIPVPSGIEFESQKTKEDAIMVSLTVNSVNLIGICGMGGVGKTTMARKIRQRAKEQNLFEVVAMTVVSQQPNGKRIQQEIAEALGPNLEKETESFRAIKIHARLMELKKILIIIDDIWAG